jgi:hypothetical protein
MLDVLGLAVVTRRAGKTVDVAETGKVEGAGVHDILGDIA